MIVLSQQSRRQFEQMFRHAGGTVAAFKRENPRAVDDHGGLAYAHDLHGCGKPDVLVREGHVGVGVLTQNDAAPKPQIEQIPCCKGRKSGQTLISQDNLYLSIIHFQGAPPQHASPARMTIRRVATMQQVRKTHCTAHPLDSSTR